MLSMFVPKLNKILIILNGLFLGTTNICGKYIKTYLK